jgi:hypothetical protein
MSDIFIWRRIKRLRESKRSHERFQRIYRQWLISGEVPWEAE